MRMKMSASLNSSGQQRVETVEGYTQALANAPLVFFARRKIRGEENPAFAAVRQNFTQPGDLTR